VEAGILEMDKAYVRVHLNTKKGAGTTIEDDMNRAGKHLHPTEAPRLRAFLVGAEITAKRSPWKVEDSLQELALLADTAGLEVVGQVHQTLSHPLPKFFIGPGKVRQVAEMHQELAFDVVVFDDELTASQTWNLEKELGIGVLDRTTLILDIFAQHARTHEGRLQVELAQYEYLLPRLRRQWTHLERQTGQGGTSAGGVVGLRGPGETQLEVDRRVISRRMDWLKQQLADVHRHRELYRKRRRRSGIPVAALVGYTNAGKSTLINALTDAGVHVEDQLFATLDPTTRKVALPGGREILVTDTVGFIQKLPTQLVAAFHATLEEISEADVLLHVIDMTHPNTRQQERTVDETLEGLGVADKPTLIVLNKADCLEGQNAQTIEHLVGERGLPWTYVAVSSHRRWGLETLLSRIEQTLSMGMIELDALIPYHRTDLVSLWREHGVLESQEFEAEGTYIRGRLPGEMVKEFDRFATTSVPTGAR
jgi:GTP-binding protein HflX